MNPPLEPQPRQRRDSVRHQARLDWETHSTLEARGDSAVRHAVGITHTQGWTIDPTISDRPHLMHLLVAPEMLQQVQEAADGYGTSVAAWLRHAMRQVRVPIFRRVGTPKRQPPGRMSPSMTNDGFSSASILTVIRSSRRSC